MGHSSSKHRRYHLHQQQQQENQQHNQTPSLPLPPPPTTTTTSSTTTTTNPNSNNNNNNNTNTINNNNTPRSNPIISPFLSLPPPGSYTFAASGPPPPPPPQFASTSYNTHLFNSYTFTPFTQPTPPPPPPHMYSYNHQFPGGWAPVRPPKTMAPPTLVEHKTAKKIKNDVNVHKDTIRVVLDENNLDSHLLSFTFDALVDGSITIFYFAKEGADCKFTPMYPEIYMPWRIPFQKGHGQKFSQPSGTGIDLGFFELDDLSKPSPKEDVFPLVISAESSLPSFSVGEEPQQPLPTMSPHAQITQAVLEKNNEGHFQVRVIKQILWVDGVRYELREIYGIENSDKAEFDDSESGNECVICMSEPKDTAVLPCRHMCMCSECAKALKLQSNKCPICRQPIQELIAI